MTKNEAAILNYIKLHNGCTSFDVIENAKAPDHDCYVDAKDRLQLMLDLGYISGDTPDPKINKDGSVHTLTITACGLHELDAYLTEHLRFEQIDSRSAEANRLVAEANEIAKSANDKSDEANALAKKANRISVISILIAVLSAVISVVSVCKL